MNYKIELGTDIKNKENLYSSESDFHICGISFHIQVTVLYHAQGRVRPSKC